MYVRGGLLHWCFVCTFAKSMKRLVIFLSLLISACSLRPSLEMDQSEFFLLSSHPDSVVFILKNLSAENADDSLARSVHDYYEHHGNRRQRMISSYYLAMIEEQNNNIIEAALLYKKAETIALDIQDYGVLGITRQNLAELYSANHLDEESYSSYEGAVEAFILSGDTLSADISRTFIADYFCKQSLYSEALSIIDSLLTQSEDDKVITSALRVKGNVCFSQGEWHSADSLFSLCQDNSIRVLGKRCLAQERMGRSDEADSLLIAAREACGTDADSTVYFSAARDLCHLRSDYEGEMMVLEASLANQRRIMSSILERSIPHAQGAYWKDYNLVLRLHEHNASLFVALVFLVLIISNLLCFWIMQRRRIALISDGKVIESLQKDIVFLQKEQLASKSIVNVLLQDKVNRIQQLSGAFFKWSDEAFLLREERYGKVMKDELISDFRKELRSFRDDPNLFKEIEIALDQAQGHIMQSFRHAVSQTSDIILNERDFALVTLFFARFSSKSISFLMGMTEEAVRKRKSRYRKLFSELGDSFSPFIEALK